MDVDRAIENALLILDEGTTRPTVNYVYVGKEWLRAYDLFNRRVGVEGPNVLKFPS
jgi:hypothetical protein